MQSSSSDSSNDILKSISSLLRELTVGSHESAASDVNVSLKTIAGNLVSTDPRYRYGVSDLLDTAYRTSSIRCIGHILYGVLAPPLLEYGVLAESAMVLSSSKSLDTAYASRMIWRIDVRTSRLSQTLPLCFKTHPFLHYLPNAR
ncbi:hypothetical protein Tco_0233843 [Tanacetum coccineum]